MAKEKVKKPFYKKWWVWLLAVIIVGSIAAGGGEDSTETADAPASETATVDVKKEVPTMEEKKEEPNVEAEETATKEEVKEEEPVAEEPVAEEPAEPEMTLSQKNAIQTAKDYLDYTAFSKKSLIEQLGFDGYTTEEATFAVNSIGEASGRHFHCAFLHYIEFLVGNTIHPLSYMSLEASGRFLRFFTLY